jgi:N-acetylneuraminic acid mutarotase
MLKALMLTAGLICRALVSATVGPSQEGQWITLAPMNEPRQEVAVAELNGRIYVIGGLRRDRSTANTVEAYNPVTNTWQFVAPLPLPLHHTTAASVGGKLYVIGGLSSLLFTPTNATFEYDPQANRWQSKRPLPGSRGALAVAVIEGKIYAAGGSPSSRERDFAVYDPVEDSWTTLSRMPTPRNHLAAGAIGKRFYAVGGRTSGGDFTLDVLEIFDTETSAWMTGPPMPTGRSGIGAVVVNGVLYVFGGEGNPSHPNGVFEQNEAFFPAEGVWRARAPMPTPRHGIGAAAIENIIYIPGGGPVQGLGVTDVNEAFILEP